MRPGGWLRGGFGCNDLALRACATAAPAFADDGKYIDIGYGTVTLDSKQNAGSILKLTGGMRVTENLDAELMYAHGIESGETLTIYPYAHKIDGSKIRSAFGVYIKPKISITDDVEAYGRLGYVNMRYNEYSTYNYAAPMQPTYAESSKTSNVGSLSYGLGVKAKLTKDVALTADYMVYADVDKVSAKGFSIGIQVGF